MTFEKISIHPLNYESRKENFKKLVPATEFELVMDFLNSLRRGEVTGKPVSQKRIAKLMSILAIYFKNSKIPLKKLEKSDLQQIKDELSNGEIKRDDGKTYSDETMEDFCESFVRLLEWIVPEKIQGFGNRNISFRKWFVTRAAFKTPVVLSEEEVKLLIKKATTVEGKFLICVMFDSGCRVEEFCNIRFEDIEYPTKDHPYFRIDFRTEYSKSEGRKVSMFWNESTERIQRYLGVFQSKDPKERVFKKSYEGIRIYLEKMGKAVLNKKINPHMLRKSSCTFYSGKMNRQQLCIRYGWKFKSDMPDIYINRQNVDEKEVKKVFFNNELSDLKKENQELRERFEQLQKEFELIHQFIPVRGLRKSRE